MYDSELKPHPTIHMNKIFHFPYLSTNFPAGILKPADVSKKTAESMPTCKKDTEKRLITNIEYTGPRKPIPREENEIRVSIILIDNLCKHFPPFYANLLVLL